VFRVGQALQLKLPSEFARVACHCSISALLRPSQTEPYLTGVVSADDTRMILYILTVPAARVQMAAITERDRQSASIRQAWAGARLHTSGPNQRAAAAPNLMRQASPKFAAMVLQNARQVPSKPWLQGTTRR